MSEEMFRRIAEIQARADAATGRPWEVRGDEDYGFEVHGQREPSSIEGLGKPTEVCAPSEERNAEFIAASRTDVPALVAALRAVLDVCSETTIEVRPHGGGKPYMIVPVDEIRAAVEDALGDES